MAAVIRLKRHCKEEPLEALLLACKRKKLVNDTPSEEESPFTTILKFAGTVENKEEDVAVHISKTLREDVKKIYSHIADVSGKLRRETRQSSQQNRFKVVNLFRSISNTDASEPNANAEKSDLPGGKDDGLSKPLTVVDVVRHESKDAKSGKDPTNETQEMEMDENYVFDIYYAGDINDALLDNLVSVHSVNSELLRFNELPDVSDSESSEDSNDENNWRNDYPDSDHSVNEDDMRLALEMDECNLGELSSDEGEEGLLYSQDVDPLDVNRYGKGYASFKARVNKELYSSGGEDDEDDPDYVPKSSEDENTEDPSLRFM